MNPDELRKQLAFYRDLGVKEVYRRKPKAAADAPVVKSNVAKPNAVKSVAASGPPPALVSAPASARVAPAIQVAKSVPDIVLPPLAPLDDTLLKIQQDIGDCRRCRLCEQRTKIVFGSGNEEARLVFVGEGPGADEDAQGLPFVGRAGQLLTQMIEGTAVKEGIPIKRPDVYICNVVKCRPPENRAPQPDEMEICGQFLFRQLMAIRPKAICAMGSTAAKAILATKDGVTRLRGQWHKWRDIPVMVTYHPSYLLRAYNQEAKREAWEDLKKVLHFVYD
jgi:uracil-DNA glycosylase family 4